MSKTILEYRRPERPDYKGINEGHIAYLLVLGGFLLAMFIPFISLAAWGVAIILSPYSVIASKGRSICGWIASAVCVYFVVGMAWMIITGR